MTLNFQGLDGEAKALMEKLEANITLLCTGWREKIEYVVPVKYHDLETCTAASRVSTVHKCGCPVKDEKRSRHIKVDSLLDQLQTYTKSKDVDRNPKAARQAPRVKKVKYMPELNGYFTLDEIVCDAYIVIENAYRDAYGDTVRSFDTSRPIRQLLGSLAHHMGDVVNTHPDTVNDVVKATSKWVAMARRTLNMTVAEAQFGSTVCGNCNGGLAIAWDNGSDVRCVGTPTTPPCGETYGMDTWIDLYTKGRSTTPNGASE